MNRPPYARSWPYHWPGGTEIHIWTGADAWERAKSETHCPTTPKTLLPFGEDPKAFRWPVFGASVIILGETDRETLEALSRALVFAGARRVLWCCTGHPLTRVDPATGRRAA